MRKFILGAAAVLALMASAAAADMPKGPVYKAAPAVFDWTGFYAGVDAGYMAARVDDAIVGVVAAASSKPDGLVGGVHLGYRRQMPNKVVWGVEVDFWGGDVDGFQLYPGVGNNSLIDINWGGSVRGVLGVAMSPTLLYVTGGAAFANIEGCVSVILTKTCGAGSNFDQTRLGWTVGAGLAHAITPRAIVRLEYLFADYGSKNITDAGAGLLHSVDFQTHTVRAGLSWRFTTR